MLVTQKLTSSCGLLINFNKLLMNFNNFKERLQLTEKFSLSLTEAFITAALNLPDQTDLKTLAVQFDFLSLKKADLLPSAPRVPSRLS